MDCLPSTFDPSLRDICGYNCCPDSVYKNNRLLPLGFLYIYPRILFLHVLAPSPDKGEGVGFGVVGELPEPMATVEFMRRMQRVLGVRVVRHSDIASPEVRRVAVCTGAGASMIGDARRAGADIYVTADMKYNDFMTPDKALTVADIGHFESEYCAIQILFDILSKNLITFAVRKSESSRNPVNYLV